MKTLEIELPTRALFGPGALNRIGELARELDFRRTLVVCDPGISEAGYYDRVARLLEDVGTLVFGYHDFSNNPDSDSIESGRAFVQSHNVDSIVGLGGGSSMDCAKGINFLLTNGGRIQDYWGYQKALLPMLPMIGVPTTAGTGSEAQSYALICDSETHVKMACGDPKAAFKVAILDPELTLTQPRAVRAAAAYDAISHVVETRVTTERTATSLDFTRKAAPCLLGSFENVMEHPDNIDVNGDMLLGAFYAGAAIEHSMLGATHACANPLTARYGTEHGVAIAHMLPHVVRWNGVVCGDEYAELATAAGLDCDREHATEMLAQRLEVLAVIGGFDTRLRTAGIEPEELPSLAADASKQWTGQFNPRPFDEIGALEIYECAY